MATLFIALAAVLLHTTEAATYIVGDSTGWILPPTNDFYDYWVASKNFFAGDILEFNFTTGQQDVAEVTEADYDACATNNTIYTVTNGPARIRINDHTTDHYFTCTFPGHCSGGQKVKIAVDSYDNSPPRNGPPSVLSPNSASPIVATISLALMSIALVLILCDGL